MSNDPARLTTFGALALTASTGASLLPPGKPLALVAYLLLAPGRRASREHLVNLLWADLDPERARATLRQTLTVVRRALGAEAIGGSDGDVCLEAALNCDCVEFMDATAAGERERAVALYAGEFIPDFAIPGGTAFEHWRDVEAERLRALFLRNADWCVRSLTGNARFDAAIELASRAVRAAHGDEAVRRQLIEVLVAAGRIGDARTEGERLRADIGEDAREAAPATRALLKRLETAAMLGAEAAADGQLRPSFVGREAAFAELLRAWHRAQSGRAVTVTLSAPPGYGKTRLLNEAAARLRVIGARVVRIDSRRTDRDVPGVTVADLVTCLSQLKGASGVSPASAAVLADLAPNVATTLRADARLARLEDLPRTRALALADLVSAVAEEGDLVIVADDWQWADAVSRQIIETAFARVTATRVLLVIASRGHDHIAGHAHVDLDPLPLAQTRALVESIADVGRDHSVEAAVNALHRASRGIPLLLLQMLYAVRERNWFVVADGQWRVDDATSLRAFLASTSFIDARLHGASADSQGVLRLLAIADRSLTAGALADASGESLPVVRAALATLEDRALVDCAGEHWRIAHDEIGAAVVAATSADDAVRDHARLAVALATTQPTTADECREIARHSVAGGTPHVLLEVLAGMRERAVLPRLPVQRLVETYVGVSLPPKVAVRVRAILDRHRTGRRALMAATLAGLITFAALIHALLVPVELRVVQPPVARQAGALFEVPPVIEAVTRLGARARIGARWIEMVAIGDDVTLGGATRVRTAGGVAAFDSARANGNVGGAFVLRFQAPGIATLDHAMNANRPRLEVIAGELNGARVNAGDTIVVVRAAARLAGWVQLRYTTPWSGSTVLMAGVATWQPRAADTLDVTALITPTAAARTVVRIDRPMPSGLGPNLLIWAFATEARASSITSGTNWECSRAGWNDGNDLADVTDDAIDTLSLAGYAVLPWDFCSRGETAPRRLTRDVGFAALRIVVTNNTLRRSEK